MARRACSKQLSSQFFKGTILNQNKLLDLIQKETGALNRTLVIVAGLSGIANAGILAIINAASLAVENESENFRYLMMFAVAITLYTVSLKYTLNQTGSIFEDALHRLRTRITAKIRQVDLDLLDSMGSSRVYNTLTQEMATISQSQMVIAAALQACFMVVFVGLYIASISVVAFLLTALTVWGGLIIYFSKQAETNQCIQEMTQKQEGLVTMITELIAGFKELKMNRSKAQAFQEDLDQESQALRDITVKTTELYNFNYIFSQSFFYLLMAVLVFLMPRLMATYSEHVIELTASILFIIGPLTVIVNALPSLQKSSIAAEHLEMLESHLDAGLHESAEGDTDRILVPFKPGQDLTVDQVCFCFRDRSGDQLFKVGPFSFELKPGELMIVVGGNGSGKSTLMKLLTGLYSPDEGELRYGSQVINRRNRSQYRELFSLIFTDFHLFRKLYGLKDITGEQVHDLIQRMDLQSKIAFTGNGFSSLDLSTGQRKRLALIVSLLEDRSIYILDEWAADQDPEFRATFYKEILPELKAAGKTIIAVSHDDKYFDCADRIMKMEYGQIEYLGPPDGLPGAG